MQYTYFIFYIQIQSQKNDILLFTDQRGNECDVKNVWTCWLKGHIHSGLVTRHVVRFTRTLVHVHVQKTKDINSIISLSR